MKQRSLQVAACQPCLGSSGKGPGSFCIKFNRPKKKKKNQQQQQQQ